MIYLALISISGSILGFLSFLLFFPILGVCFLSTGFVFMVLSGYVGLGKFRNADSDSGIWSKFISSIHAGVDALLLGVFRVSLRRVPVSQFARIHHELMEVTFLIEREGWDSDPRSYYARDPLLPKFVSSINRKCGHISYKHLQCESAYSPYSFLPGSKDWNVEKKHQVNHAWSISHENLERPWVVCIHGFGLGRPALDFAMLNARYLHLAMGFNLLFPILSCHGPKALNFRSGDGFFTGDVLTTLNAISQSVCDIRSWVAWLKSKTGVPPSLFGISLGGYHAAVVASLERDTPRVVLGVPLVDPADTVWSHAPLSWTRKAMKSGLTKERVNRIWSLTSPLKLSPPDMTKKSIFAANNDLIIKGNQVQLMLEHWKDSKLKLCDTGHVTFRMASDVTTFVGEGLVVD